ncbi:hypothetical protein B0T16DRAFT_138874 [Cercophora newfieldiana]|uniref:Uncharacterized protein n=1 Tax=Cercophora newfieldiana TaxID=92897 RepID=A0AA39YC85_9PEZI|nr:hypothetical protein B0T16DRAFT_138874 [Cercophora newfieldiana]
MDRAVAGWQSVLTGTSWCGLCQWWSELGGESGAAVEAVQRVAPAEKRRRIASPAHRANHGPAQLEGTTARCSRSLRVAGSTDVCPFLMAIARPEQQSPPAHTNTRPRRVWFRGPARVQNGQDQLGSGQLSTWIAAKKLHTRRTAPVFVSAPVQPPGWKARRRGEGTSSEDGSPLELLTTTSPTRQQPTSQPLAGHGAWAIGHGAAPDMGLATWDMGDGRQTWNCYPLSGSSAQLTTGPHKSWRSSCIPSLPSLLSTSPDSQTLVLS